MEFVGLVAILEVTEQSFIIFEKNCISIFIANEAKEIDKTHRQYSCLIAPTLHSIW